MHIEIHRHTHQHHDPAVDRLIVEVRNLREDIMALSQEVQIMVDAVAKETTLVGSVDKAMKALQAQVADLTSKLNALPVTPAPSLSDEDKAAIVQASSDLSATITTLQQDIPTNVAIAPAAAVPPAPAVLPDTQEADSQAAASAKPMGGPASVTPPSTTPLIPGTSTPAGTEPAVPPPDSSQPATTQAPVDGQPVPPPA